MQRRTFLEYVFCIGAGAITGQALDKGEELKLQDEKEQNPETPNDDPPQRHFRGAAGEYAALGAGVKLVHEIYFPETEEDDGKSSAHEDAPPSP